MGGNLSQTEVMQTLNFCIGAIASNNGPEKQALLDDLRSLRSPNEMTDEEYRQAIEKVKTVLTPDQLELLNSIRKRGLLIPDDMINLDSTGANIINGMSANLITGQLGLRMA